VSALYTGQIFYNALFPCASAYLMTFNFSDAVYDRRLYQYSYRLGL